MRDEFWEYYPLTDEDIETINSDALVVLDANALLHSYRLSPSTAEAWLEMLEALAERVWIPHQAALEYQRNRIDVISGQSKLVTAIERALDSSFGDLRSAVGKRQSDINRSRVLDLAELNEAIEESHARVATVVAAGRDRQTDLTEAASASDQIHKRLTALLAERVGEPPDREWMDQIHTEGKQRFAAKQPPGFADAKKDSNPEDPYGDLILWKQLLSEAKNAERPAVLITEERKDDWIRNEAGRNLGPQPALRREFHTHAGQPFWLYSVAGFMRVSSHFGHPTSNEAIVDAERLEAEAATEAAASPEPRLEDIVAALDRLSDPDQIPDDELRSAVGEILGEWVTSLLRSKRTTRSGPAAPELDS
jgi:hypothetical protein